ncbi:MAG TPA: GTP-binding protein [Alphaproteobacteria bacterium]|nr:GTP-binding protein [Alphaproteobacteria bacterium]
METVGKAGEPIPVTVLTGFLGSGKTTLLGKLLRRPGMADTAVIINEFGEVGLDHLLVAKGEENVVLLDSGCLCCMISNSLSETLADLYFRRVRGEIPAFKRAVIETTGLADPAPILQTLMTNYLVASHYALDGVVATVDAVHGMGQLDAHMEALKQAAVADRIVVTKADLVDRQSVAALRERVQSLNPSARLVEAVQGELEPAEILDAGLYDPSRKSLDVQRWLREEALVAESEAHGHGHAADDRGHEDDGQTVGHAHTAYRHDDRVRSFCIYLDEPVSWQGYAAWIEALRALRGENLLRVKGLIEIEGTGRPYVVQGVQHVFSPPLRLDAWPSDDRRSRLVFITRDLDRAAIESALDLLRDPSAAWKAAVDRAVKR